MSKEEKVESKEETIELELQLGDVIQIFNPVNEILNTQIFIIDYIDKLKAYLLNTETFNKIKINISDKGVFGDGNITKIAILSRADTPSYAIQNGLLPGRWINIYFGGDFPIILTGEITNLEEDMIEVTTTDKDILYINFDYKGIPEDLPIENIEIRGKPIEPLVEEKKDEEVEVLFEVPELEKEKKMVETEKIQMQLQVKDVKDQLREFIVKADQIQFGDEELGPIVQFMDVSTKSQRFSIEVQVTDLLDDILSTIPNTQRTPKVLNNIHIMIERFKQLRELFSTFDQYGNVDSVLKNSSDHKPLKFWLQNFNINLYWILPVVKNIKKVYNVDDINEENNDIINIDITDDIKKMIELVNKYRSNDLQFETNNYASLYSELAKYFTPFNLVDEENSNSIIIEKEVHNNINTIIDNLEDMYSSVFSNNIIRNKKFVMTKYNLGESKLNTTESSGSKLVTIRVPITNNDVMSIKSILTLPEPTIRFSKINLPGTSILDRANLNESFLNYWEFLKNKTNYSNIFLDSINNEIEFDETTFVSGIRNYILNIPEEEIKNMTRTELYSKYINAIVPKTRILFGLMKKYIKGKLSIVDVVSYLEPFLIYSDDLTFMQYREIIKFIDEKISNYNKNMIEFSRIFKLLSNIRVQPPVKSKAFSIIDMISNNLKDDIFEMGYQFDKPEEIFTNSEILRKISLKDYSKLYTTTISLQNISLMFPSDISEVIESENKKINQKIKDEDKFEKCRMIIITKLYNSIEQIENDNDKIIYFDKKYDKTNYGVMEDTKGYGKELFNLSPEQLKQHIINDQIKKNNLSEFDASYIADTLIDGNKKVIDGQYAILYNGFQENTADEYNYYLRKDNKWVLDNSIKKENVVTDDSSILCNLEEKCISRPTKTDNNCESMKVNELSLQNSLLIDILSEFDSKYKVSKEEFEKNIKEKWEYFMSIMPIISKIEINNLLKYNNQKYKLGIEIDKDSTNIIESPFTKIINVILSQKDFVKKQQDIITFVEKFTRPFIIGGFTSSGKSENEHWLYCIKTNEPLLPAFKKELALAFIKSPYQYQYTLDIIKSKIGALSDDGDWWTDKFTGWPICPGEFDIEEGYDEGFKISTRSLMEDDAGNKIMASTAEKTIKYITPETIMINNIINAISVAMGINIENQKEFIINCVVETIRNTVESESDYKEKIKIAVQKGKKLPSYRDFFNTALLYYTLGMCLIACQISIPSIKTRKTHPGCVRSFSGYPFEGSGDLTSLTYLACVSYDIRESGEPWNVIKKTNIEKIKLRIKASIDDYLIELPEVKRKFEMKTEYFLTNPSVEISEEHDIARWSDFLPPLVPFKIKHLVNISEEFKRSLVNDLKNGGLAQREKILVIESKIIQFSLAIQEKIQEVVKQHKVILHTSNNEPYLENSCCDSNENESTFKYFTDRNSDIIEYNNIVTRLTNIIEDIQSNTKSVLFLSKINTKNFYPALSNNFDEKTIYLAFIFYCKFKSLLQIPDDLLPICTNKPDNTLINFSDPIERIIQRLKDDGRNYTNEQFLRLIQLISRENIIKINIDNPIISQISKLSGLLESIYDENNENEILEQSLRDLILNAIDTFDVATEENTKEVRELNNFLIRNNEEMTKEIIDFIQKNSGSNVTKNSIKKFTDTLNNLNKWSYDTSNRNEDIKISNDAMYNITHFYKTYIQNFIDVFPNIILNKVNYNDTNIPKYYGFSSTHQNKLKKYISEYFEKLKVFYGIPTLLNVLFTIQQISKNLVKLSDATPCFSNIVIGDKILKVVIDERTSRYLFEYYLLRILISYINLSDEDNMIVTEVKKNVEVTDIFTVEYIEETETRVDLGITSRTKENTKILTGNKKELRQKVSELLIAFMDIFRNEKQTIDITYEDIQDKVFKLREKEKDMVTDRLKSMTDEERDADTILKVTKQGLYSKGLQKGLTMYDKDFYEDEQNLRDEMLKAERKIRSKNKDANDENIDILVDEYMEQKNNEADIDVDAYDMSYMNEDFFNGNTDGVDAPEEEYDDYTNYY
jgi:hypothetical protein